MTDVIYEPRGRAGEYAQLACNLYQGCSHGCGYCYVPIIRRIDRDTFHRVTGPRKDIIRQLEKACQKRTGEPRPVHLCFTCDPYQPTELPDRSGPADYHDVTREALEMLEYYHMNVQILTKGGMRAARDFDLMERNGWTFGTTLHLSQLDDQRKWEPHAAGISDRINAIELAKSMGIRTWVSVKPVLDPDQALHIIRILKPLVDFWKIGKINHGFKIHPHLGAIERDTNWEHFVKTTRKILNGKEYIIKKDLLNWVQEDRS